MLKCFLWCLCFIFTFFVITTVTVAKMLGFMDWEYADFFFYPMDMFLLLMLWDKIRGGKDL